MDASAIIKHFNILEDTPSGLVSAPVVVIIDKLGFQCGEKAFTQL